MDDFLQKLKKVVRVVLNGPAISQSDCKKTSPYQLQYNKMHNTILEENVPRGIYISSSSVSLRPGETGQHC